MIRELPADGERFLPESMDGVIRLEHLHRYLFSLQFVAGRRVLDVACGEGYGSALLAGAAAEVTGVDISVDAVEHAAAKYQAGNLRFVVGDCAQLPLPDACVDVVTSFETIEHHDRHEEMLAEIRRVLAPDGCLVMSSPDRLEYSERPGLSNPFHVKELYEHEFLELLGRHFPNVRLLRQRVAYGSVLFTDAGSDPVEFFGPLAAGSPSRRLPAAPYLVAVASSAPLPTVAGGLFEGDPLGPARPFILDSNIQISRAIARIAAPESQVLREALSSPWYTEHNADVSSTGVDRYQHWRATGHAEGRLPAADPAALIQRLLEERLQGGGDGALPGHEVPPLLSRFGEATSLLLEAAARMGDATSRIERSAQALDERGAAERDQGGRAIQAAELARDALEAALRAAGADREHSLAQVLDEQARLSAEATQAAERLAGLQTELAESQAQLQLAEAARTEATARADAERERAHALERRMATQSAQQQAELRAVTVGHADERAAWLQQLESLQSGMLAESRARDIQVARDTAAAAAREDRLSGELASARRDLTRIVAEFNELMQESTAEREAARLRTEAGLAILNKRIASMEASWTWRLTAPLRSLTRRIQALTGRTPPP